MYVRSLWGIHSAGTPADSRGDSLHVPAKYDGAEPKSSILCRRQELVLAHNLYRHRQLLLSPLAPDAPLHTFPRKIPSTSTPAIWILVSFSIRALSSATFVGAAMGAARDRRDCKVRWGHAREKGRVESDQLAPSYKL